MVQARTVSHRQAARVPQTKTEHGVIGECHWCQEDVANDAATDGTQHEVRELYLDHNGSSAGLRAGRQIITWGVGDLVFINDIFPKNWNALFSGKVKRVSGTIY